MFLVLPVKENQYTCPTMKPINKVTLKGGLQAGDFTDIGRVTSIGDCYNVCCQQEKCDLAFMLGQNCFTVSCKDKRLCVTTPAQPSIFNPQIAYVTKRGLTNVKKESKSSSGKLHLKSKFLLSPMVTQIVDKHQKWSASS